MLGLRGGDHRRRLLKIKKIKSRGSRAPKKIKEINRNRPRFQIVQTASVFGSVERHFTITSEEQGFGLRDFMQRTKPFVLSADERKSPNKNQVDFKLRNG